MEIEDFELIECAPYSARVTARVCGLRRLKALSLIKQGAKDAPVAAMQGKYAEFAAVERCASCDEGARHTEVTTCQSNGCVNPVRKDGLCVIHYNKERAKTMTEEFSKAQVEGEDDPACSHCGKKKSQSKRWNNKRLLCGSCQTSAYLAAKKDKAASISSPSTGEGRGEGEASTGDVIAKLQEDLYACLNKAKEIHEVLTGLKKLSGVDIFIPEINF